MSIIRYSVYSLLIDESMGVANISGNHERPDYIRFVLLDSHLSDASGVAQNIVLNKLKRHFSLNHSSEQFSIVDVYAQGGGGMILNPATEADHRERRRFGLWSQPCAVLYAELVELERPEHDVVCFQGDTTFHAYLLVDACERLFSGFTWAHLITTLFSTCGITALTSESKSY